VRRLALIIAALVLVSPATALATELDEVLERSKEATYSAEQIISCSTPDGVRDAIVRITQDAGDVTVSSSLGEEVEVSSGAGVWSLSREGGLVAEATVSAGDEKTEPVYVVEDGEEVEFLGRDALSYLLMRDGELRAELLIDDETGAVLEAVTYTVDAEVYCERRFVSFDTTQPLAETEAFSAPGVDPLMLVEESSLPEEVLGFQRLDQYQDDEGLRFAYYSDGFFSFALFETSSVVSLTDATTVGLDSGAYTRLFTAGQVTYVWETRAGGMALIGDLPPDLHEAVLAEMPHPQDPGFFRRWWRNLFGVATPR